MFDYEITVAGIEFKVRQLAAEVTTLRNTIAELTDRCNSLQQQIDEKQNIINNLNEQNKIIKLGNRLTQEGDSTELKLKINQMIRAIDKSLDILKTPEQKI